MEVLKELVINLGTSLGVVGVSMVFYLISFAMGVSFFNVMDWILGRIR